MTVRFGLWVKVKHLSCGHVNATVLSGPTGGGLIDLFVAAALVDRIQIDNHGHFAKLVLDV